MPLLVNFGFGVATAVGLYFIGIPYPGLWGFLAGALRYIPYLGAWLGAIFPLAVSLLFNDGWIQPSLVVVLFGALELYISYALEPLLYGRSIGVSVVALLSATVFWAWLWGPIGLLLATPLTACLIVLGRLVPHMGFLVILLGDRPLLKLPISYYQRLLARDHDEAIDLVEDYLSDHTVRDVYENILLPAPIITNQNKSRSDFTLEGERFILQAVRETLEDLALVRKKERQQTRGSSEAIESASDVEKVLVFGCPAKDEAEELALQLLRQLLDNHRCQFEVIPVGTLAGEIVARVQGEEPSLVCIGVLPFTGLAPARYLCKRLRAEEPALRIAVDCWGLSGVTEQARERLAAAGADYLSVTLEETRAQILAQVQVLSQARLPEVRAGLAQ
jgi:hypothetical protein